MSKQLATLRWALHQSYFVAVAKPDSVTSLNLEGICRTMEKKYGGKPVIYQNRVLVVFAPQQDADYGDICQKLFYFAQKEQCIIGVSDLFSDFMALSTYYQQALFAAECSALYAQPEASGFMRRYSEVAVIHILQAASSAVDLSLVCDPFIERLSEYDSCHGTDYLHTLEVFLNHERNIAAAANELFIHRSTMLYRIDRLKKMFAGDFQHPAARLRLLISIDIYRFRQAGILSDTENG